MNRRYSPAWLILAACFTMMVPQGCGDEDPWPLQPRPNQPSQPAANNWPTGQISIDLDSGLTVIEYDPLKGKTTILVQFVVRDAQGFPGDTSEYGLQMFINDQQIDVEAIPDSSVEQLETSVLLSLVLDASYSMVSPDVTPFTTILQRADSVIRIGKAEWNGRPGEFYWNLSWFNETIFTPLVQWQPEDIRTIPKPGPGSSTKLFAAADAMVDLMKQQYDQGVASGSRDRHVMLVFSDGADNYSWFDNSGVSDTGTTSGGKKFSSKGYSAVSLNQLTSNIKSHPALTVHVGGFKDKVNESELKAIADAGKGLYIHSPATADLQKFFGRVLRELTTVQTRQFLIPLQQGDYTFKLVVSSRNNTGNKATRQFRFHTGDDNTGVL